MKALLSWKIGTSIFGVIFVLLATSASGQFTNFFDNFNGPSLNPMWSGTLPDAPGASGDSAPETYVGAPGYYFETINGDSVVLLTNSLSDLQRAGWSLQTNFYLSNFHYEVRFNTLIQSPTTSFDAFMEIWILDSSNSNYYDIVSLFAGSYGSDRHFRAGSSISGATFDQAFSFQDNTFYRLVLQGSGTNDVTAALYDDSGDQLAETDLGHNTSVFGPGFTIGISHAMDRPQGTYPSQTAIDYALLTTTNVPENVRTSSTRGIQVSWPTTIGKWYQFQFNTPFLRGGWQNFGNPVPGTGTNAFTFIPDSKANLPYRVQELP
jgi:hypothetical protein